MDDGSKEAPAQLGLQIVRVTKVLNELANSDTTTPIDILQMIRATKCGGRLNGVTSISSLAITWQASKQ